MGHNDELGLAGLDEVGNVVKTEFENNRLGSLLGLSTSLLGFSFSLESGLLLFLCLGLVFSKQFKELTCYLNINYKYLWKEWNRPSEGERTLVLIDGL